MEKGNKTDFIIPESKFESFRHTPEFSSDAIHQLEVIIGRNIPRILYPTVFDIRLDCRTPKELQAATAKLAAIIKNREKMTFPLVTKSTSQGQKETVTAVADWLEEAANIHNLRFIKPGVGEWSPNVGPYSVRIYQTESHPYLYMIEKPIRPFDDKSRLTVGDQALVYLENLIEARRRGAAYALPIGTIVHAETSLPTTASLIYATPADALPMHELPYQDWDHTERFRLVQTSLSAIKILNRNQIRHGDTKLDNLLWCPDEEKVVFIDPKKTHFRDFEVTIPRDQRFINYQFFGDSSLFINQAIDYRLIQGVHELEDVLRSVSWVELPEGITEHLRREAVLVST